jgi:hypothetical protein
MKRCFVICIPFLVVFLMGSPGWADTRGFTLPEPAIIYMMILSIGPVAAVVAGIRSMTKRR